MAKKKQRPFDGITPPYDVLLRGSEEMPIGLYHLHLASAKQLCRLHYSAGTVKAVRAKLRTLCDHKYVQFDATPTKSVKATRSPFYYTLDNLGYEYLQALGLDVNKSHRSAKEIDKAYIFAKHTLELNDIIISAALLKRSSNYWLGEFKHERELKQKPIKTTWHGGGFNLIPDAYLYFRVDVEGKPFYRAVLIEHDRGSEEQLYFRRRIRAYLTMFKNEAYRELFHVNSIMVAFTTSAGEERLRRMRSWTLSELDVLGEPKSAANNFYFTVLPNPLEPKQLWTEPCWYLPYGEQPVSLLRGI